MCSPRPYQAVLWYRGAKSVTMGLELWLRWPPYYLCNTVVARIGNLIFGQHAQIQGILAAFAVQIAVPRRELLCAQSEA